MRKEPRRRVSAGLVATLLGALVCVALPTWPRHAEGWAQGLLCLPLRAFGRPAAASDGDAVVVPPRLLAREQDAALADTGRLVGQGLHPIVCTVVDRDTPGAARLPSSLLLDRTVDELAGCEALVTHGGRLLGFLDRTSPPSAAAPARVQLLHARNEHEVRRLPGEVVLASGEKLRFLIEPAAAIDALPLRCAFLEDPYLASRLRGSGLEVRVEGAARDDATVGLRVGRLRLWGYRTGAATIPVGLFIEPELDPRAISRVVVWHRERRLSSALNADTGARRQPVGLLKLPAPPPDRSRWFLRSAAADTLPVGAAVLCDERFAASVSRAGQGYGLAAPFGERPQVWALVLLPSDANAPPQYLAARTVRHEGGLVQLQRVCGGPPLVAGLLFTGSNGPDCPPGLPIGSARGVVGDADGLLVSLPVLDAAQLSVVVGRSLR